MHTVLAFLKRYRIFTLVATTMIIAFAAQILGFQQTTNWLLVFVSAVALVQIVRDMIGTVREGGLGLDILALTAIVVGVLLQEYWAAVVIALMLTGGEALEDYAEQRATNELTDLLERAPKQAHLLGENGQTKDV